MTWIAEGRPLQVAPDAIPKGTRPKTALGDLEDPPSHTARALTDPSADPPQSPGQHPDTVGQERTVRGVVNVGFDSQIAEFLASDGEVVIHPEPVRFFEVPIVLPLPEDLGFIP